MSEPKGLSLSCLFFVTKLRESLAPVSLPPALPLQGAALASQSQSTRDTESERASERDTYTYRATQAEPALSLQQQSLALPLHQGIKAANGCI
ncbi:hypothetical protein chiPu_0010428 [Chiloscyllium punctatum]|uniref:Uncharacterized protein n=1 Tax=Chiloscyllium punctatum TaxID=137246 RepID=A0A401SNK9_CHIPU|nr:hypothetical protein [Chiloscyllium punctatum]